MEAVGKRTDGMRLCQHRRHSVRLTIPDTCTRMVAVPWSTAAEPREHDTRGTLTGYPCAYESAAPPEPAQIPPRTRRADRECGRGPQGTRSDEAIPGRRRRGTPSEAMSECSTVDLEEFRTYLATCRNNQGITSQGMAYFFRLIRIPDGMPEIIVMANVWSQYILRANVGPRG